MNIYNIRSGKNQNDAATYKIINLCSLVHIEQADEQASEQPKEQADEQASEQADEHIKTKLNLLFNYINNNNNKACENEFGLTEQDKEVLRMHLKRLDLLLDSNNKSYDLMSAESILDLKIMTWSVKEIYLTPYKIFLGRITCNSFMLKYLKAKEYITKKPSYKIEEIIKYFIVCLREEFEEMKTRKEVTNE